MIVDKKFIQIKTPNLFELKIWWNYMHIQNKHLDLAKKNCCRGTCTIWLVFFSCCFHPNRKQRLIFPLKNDFVLKSRSFLLLIIYVHVHSMSFLFSVWSNRKKNGPPNETENRIQGGGFFSLSTPNLILIPNCNGIFF